MLFCLYVIVYMNLTLPVLFFGCFISKIYKQKLLHVLPRKLGGWMWYVSGNNPLNVVDPVQGVEFLGLSLTL